MPVNWFAVGVGVIKYAPEIKQGVSAGKKLAEGKPKEAMREASGVGQSFVERRMIRNR